MAGVKWGGRDRTAWRKWGDGLGLGEAEILKGGEREKKSLGLYGAFVVNGDLWGGVIEGGLRIWGGAIEVPMG